jgi:hypothetical protein
MGTGYYSVGYPDECFMAGSHILGLIDMAPNGRTYPK